MAKRERIELTDTEWMKLIDGLREDTELPICCANMSTLRDDLIYAARNSGEVFFMNQIKQHLGWCFPDHDPTPLVLKVCEQLGVEVKYEDHEKDEVELQ